MSWDLGRRSASWMEQHDPVAYRGFLAGDRGVNGLAQSFHHTILPLASAADRRTEIALGPPRLRVAVRPPGARAVAARIRGRPGDPPAARRRGRPPHDPRPVAGAEPHIDTRRPYRVDLGDGRSLGGGVLRRRPVGRGLVRAAGDRRRGPLRAGRRRVADGARIAPRRRAAAGRDRHRRRAVRPPPDVRRAVPRTARPASPR